MIRVLQLLTSTALGGGPRQVLHLVRHLPADEFQVSVAGPPDERFAEDLRAVGIEPAVVRVDSLRALPLTLHRVMGLVRDTRADVVHTHGKGAGFYGRVAAKLAGVPAVHTFHGIHYETYSLVGRRLYVALERAMARITHTVINVSESQDLEALRLGLARRGHSKVVVNGIDFAELDARRRSGRAELDLKDDDQVIGCVARFDPIKRHELLVDALAIVSEGHPKVVLLLAGEGPERARIEAHAKLKNVQIRIRSAATAWKTNLYTTCDLYVASSSKEGLPLAPLEAMASERAVVATNVSGHKDIVKDPDTGLLVPPDPQKMADAITSLLNDPEQRRQMGKRGAARVREQFTLQSMVAKTAEVYRAAAASGRATRRS